VTEEATFDLVVIGGGPAGYVGAIRGAQLGASVAVVEMDSWGGTCLNRGCIPSKALIHAVEAIEVAKEARTFGICFGEPGVDWDGIRKFKSRAVKQLVSGVELLLDGNGVRKFLGRGKLLGDGTVQITAADGTQCVINGNTMLVATGSVPLIPPIPGLDSPQVFSSDQAVDLPGPFESIAVVGAGALGCEFAYIYSQLGAKVSLFEMLPQVVPTEDPDIAEVLEKSLRRNGVAVHTSTKVIGVHEVNGRKRVEYECQGECAMGEFDAILVAVGRKAATSNIGLEELGVTVERAGIKVNDRLETNVPGVYAAGDCIRGAGLAHLASHEAVAAVENALGEGGHVNYDCVPACIFSHPEIGRVGITEKQAREAGRDISVGCFPFAANSRAVATRQREGMVKLIADAGSGQLIGAAIVGPAASELIAAPALAIELGAKASEVADTIHSHPTFAEAIHEAALCLLHRPLHLPPPGKKAARGQE
jgi:dihydrolipoamide dehydrogenase